MTKESDTIELIQKRMTGAAKTTDQLLEDPRYRALFHAPEKGEALQLDIIILGTHGMIVTPANLLPTIKMIAPGWSPGPESDFSQIDAIEQYWLVTRAEEEERATWWELVREKGLFFTLTDPRQWEALLELVGDRTRPSDETDALDDVGAVDLKSWLRQASVHELQALADTRWGRSGLLEETRESMRKHYGSEPPAFLDIDSDDIISVGSDSDRILTWLSRVRPEAFISITLVPYLSEHLPAGICIEMDAWLKTAVGMVRPELAVDEVETTSMSSLAKALLEEIPDPDGNTKDDEP